MGTQRGIISIRGKVGDEVFTDGKLGKRVRSTPTLSKELRKSKAESPQLKKTHASNGIASSINKAVKHYAGALKPGNFYQALHKKFGEEHSPERTLKLSRLWNMEINERYSFRKALLDVKTDVRPEKKKYHVDVQVSMPPVYYLDKNSFSLEMIFLVFRKGTDECLHSVQYSSWMYINEHKTKYFSFVFDREAGETDYLLACRAVFAHNANEEDIAWSSTVMRILTGGAATKKGMKMLEDAAVTRRIKTYPKQVPKVKKRVEGRDEK